MNAGMEETRALLRHLVATIAHRAGHCLRDAPPGFPDFAAGAGVRTPAQILGHLTGLMHAAGALLTGAPRRESPAAGWEAGIAAFEDALRGLDAAIAGAAAWREPLPALQGPLADALTHIGQLALLRRLAGAPIAGGGYPRADIRAGEIGLG